MSACVVCGEYVYRLKRHKTCAPAYRRAQLKPCAKCQRPMIGKRLTHAVCRNAPAEFQPCGYCGDASRGAFHNSCYPVGMGELAIFPDDPDTVQRRCSRCRDWFPFASVDGAEDANTSFAWSPHGRSKSGRRLYDPVCRGCISAARRERRTTVAA